MKVGKPLESKPGIQLSSRDTFGYMKLYSNCCAELGVPLDLGQCSQECLELPKEVKQLFMFDGECSMALEPIRHNRASSRVDLWYSEHFRIDVVSSGSL